jgi:hypothetical protein
MYPNTTDPFYDHTQLVQAVTNGGIDPPEEWTALLNRFNDYTGMQYPIRERLTAALIDGTDDDIAALKALVLAEQLAQAGSQASGEVEARVLHRLKQLYAAVAVSNYEVLQGKFDTAARKFCEQAAVCDVTADGSELVGTPEKRQKAWIAAALIAAELTELIPPLAAAMTLAGNVDVFLGDHTAVLPLVCDPSDLNRRDVWTAYDDTTGRCNHWGPLAKLGVPIRAANIEGFATYRRPAALEPRQRQQVGAPRGIVERYWHDPETDVEPIDPFRSTGRLVTG